MQGATPFRSEGIWSI